MVGGGPDIAANFAAQLLRSICAPSVQTPRHLLYSAITVDYASVLNLKVLC